MRDRYYSKQKPANTKRIAVIGDSYTMGSGVADHENYTTLIENKFTKQYPEMNIEVLNFGVGGYGLRNYDAVLRSKAMLFDPDLLIIGFSDNDHELPKQEELEGKIRLNRPVEMFYRSHLKLIYDMKIKNRRPFTQVDPSNQNQVTHIESHFSSIISQCNQKEIPAIIAYCPFIYNEVTTRFYKEKSEESGFHFINAGKELEDIPRRKVRVNLLDSHPNEIGHQVYADNIYEFIVREDLLSLNR
ncbi:MAG: SGNH/GDSL hydrolase family protein [Cytophagia bacterium]|nr:SGNH/GDSL hydrolase family protein [Cytophagia bacterium]